MKKLVIKKDKLQNKHVSDRCPVQKKLQYATEKEAQIARKRVRKKIGSKLVAYQCKYCKLWHIGHSRKPEFRAGNRDIKQ